MERQKIKDILLVGETGKQVLVKGWVRTKRGSKNVNFIALNDGSTIHNIQVVADVNNFDDAILREINTGASLSVIGKLEESAGSGQKVELIAEKIELLGKADPEKFPIQPKKHSLEFLRENAHLRFRTNTFGAVFRIRHAMAFAIHNYFNEKGFYYLHTPIVTASDAAGAGQLFRVSTLDPKNPPLNEEGEIDYSLDFFGRPTNLTVSGQLEGELGALALVKYTRSGQHSEPKIQILHVIWQNSG